MACASRRLDDPLTRIAREGLFAIDPIALVGLGPAYDLGAADCGCGSPVPAVDHVGGLSEELDTSLDWSTDTL